MPCNRFLRDRIGSGVRRRRWAGCAPSPLVLAIVTAAAERKLALAEVSAFDSPTGKGVVGTVDGRKLHLGNARFLANQASILARSKARPSARARRYGDLPCRRRW